LSEYFEIISYRYGKKAKVRFELGKITNPLQVKEITKTDKHGTTVIFKPSTFFMGDDCAIPYDGLTEWLEKIIYLIPSDIKINFNINKNGKETSLIKKYRNKNGLFDYVKKLSKTSLLDPIHFQNHINLKETIPVKEQDTNGNPIYSNKEVNRFVGIEVAFTFNIGSTELVTDSFCNFINTIDGGVHIDAVKQGIMQYFTRQTKEALSDKEAKNLDILFNDVTNGLVLSVFLSTDMSPQFASQTKEKLSNNEFFKPLLELTKVSLIEYFKKNPRELKRITDYVKMNAKARVEATKARNSVIKGETNYLDMHTSKKFAPANNKGKHEYRELIIIEGDSALGSARQGRFDIDTQALFALKGVPLNTFGEKLDKVLKNDEFKFLVMQLGCNIGERFNIDNLFYKKIIIMTDADRINVC
jgi:DNA gyrase/topoisomerase IV subunit B